MHPAPSIIAFTTLSSLGFGVLFFLGLTPPTGPGWAGFFQFALGGALAVVGLLASVFHLGHPERALKAFTQWRSSWLSREGWLSLAALVITTLYGALIVFFGVVLPWLGLAASALALATVGATSMIYAQIKAVPRWNHWTTLAMFIALMATGGAILTFQGALTLGLLVATGAFQIYAWHIGDRRFADAGHTIGTATGLGTHGQVRAFEPPHTGTNYLLSEMVYVVGRRHAAKVRIIAVISMSLIPAAILLIGASLAHGAFAAAFHLIGALAARWLFFAEAEHVVGLYYGKR